MDAELLAAKAAAIERHLSRVAARLPAERVALRPGTDESDAVLLHLWQAVQLAIDLATATAVSLDLGAPRTYADAFRRLAGAGVLPPDLADRLVKAAGFRNLVAHGYEEIDLGLVWDAAREGPAVLRAFLACLVGRVGAQ